MKVRFVKKILLGPDKGKNMYWLKRVIKTSFGWKEDHRVVKAMSKQEWFVLFIFIFTILMAILG